MYLFVGIVGLWYTLSCTGLTVNGEKWDFWFPLKVKYSKKKGVEVNTVAYPISDLQKKVKKEIKRRTK